MPDEPDPALAKLLDEVARIPAKRLPDLAPEEIDEKPPAGVSQPPTAGTKAP